MGLFLNYLFSLPLNLFLKSTSHVGGLIGQTAGSSFTQCHNFGFQYDASAPIIICNGACCGGFIGETCNSAIAITQCSLKRGSILIFGGEHFQILCFHSQSPTLCSFLQVLLLEVSSAIPQLHLQYPRLPF